VRLLSLLRLAREIQSHIDAATGAPGEYVLTEKVCRKLVRIRSHERQLEVFRELIGAQAACVSVENARAGNVGMPSPSGRRGAGRPAAPHPN